jgi:hypothetical protein
MNFGERLVCQGNGTLVAAASTPKAAHGRVVTRHVLSRWKGVSWLTRGESGRLVRMLAAIAFWKKGIVPKRRLFSRKETSQGRSCLRAESTMSLSESLCLTQHRAWNPHLENAVPLQVNNLVLCC